jgi:hypothetical protein
LLTNAALRLAFDEQARACTEERLLQQRYRADVLAAEAASATGDDSALIINDICGPCSIVPHCTPHFRRRARCRARSRRGSDRPRFRFKSSPRHPRTPAHPFFRSSRALPRPYMTVRTKRVGQKRVRIAQSSTARTVFREIHGGANAPPYDRSSRNGRSRLSR